MEIEEKKKLILVIGRPGVGKGTQSKLLAEKLGRLQISTGDFVREAIRYGTDFGKMAEPYVKKCQLVPDDILISALLKHIREQDAKNVGVILDGFPRTLNQALSIKAGFNVEMVILLEASDEICMKRIMKRQFEEGNSIRDFNDEQQIQERLKCFHSNIKSIQGLFKTELKVIDGTEDMNQVWTLVEKALPSFQKEPQLQKVQSQENCIICMGKPADHLVVPCGHQCGCEACLNLLFKGGNSCPICRKKITGVVRVFKSGVVDNSNPQPKIEKKIVLLEEDKSADFDNNVAKKIEIAVAPCEDIVPNKEVNVAVTINVPDIQSRRAVDVCCVIDISGSMGEKAKFQDPEDETRMKTDGMSVLDLVKHAVKTVIHTLTDRDRLSIVAFDTQARKTLPLTVMSEKGKGEAVVALEELIPEESTNIWDGLETGLDSLRTVKVEQPFIPRQKFLYLLTDGQPNVSPEGGEAKALEQYLECYPEFQCQVNTFGFGYSLKSSILLDISTVGGGIFSFIPDAKILGTNFVNAISNSATTLTQNANVHLVPKGKSTIVGNFGGTLQLKKNHAGDGVIVKIGNLQYGKARDFVIPMTISQSDNEYLEVTLEYTSNGWNNPHKIKHIASQKQKTGDATAAYVRNLVVSESYKVLKDCRDGLWVKGTKTMKALSEKVSHFDIEAENNDARLRGLVFDIIGNGERGGRMLKAVSSVERFNRWGNHYLSSITRAHQTQLCTNFIDLGLQVYAGVGFTQLQELGGKVFVTLPMTIKEIRPSNASQNYNYGNNNNNNNQPPPVVDNNNYYAGDCGGCFGGSCWVVVRTNSGQLLRKKMESLRKNDLVQVLDGNKNTSFAHVLCVVRINLSNSQKLIEFPLTGLKLTKKHPVWHQNQWKLPMNIMKKESNIASFTEETTNVVYNLVLEHSHVLLVNEIPCVTLGHGIEEAFHSFYSTSEVIDALKASSQFEDGFVDVNGSIRNLGKPNAQKNLKGKGYIATREISNEVVGDSK